MYSKYSTVVTWIGQHTVENGIEKIKTHWLHTTNIPDAKEEKWLWYSNRIGSDDFIKKVA